MTPECEDVTPHLSSPLIIGSGHWMRIHLRDVRRNAPLVFVVAAACTSVVLAAYALAAPIYTSKATICCIIATVGFFGAATLARIIACGTGNVTADSAELVREASGISVICSLPRVVGLESYVRRGTNGTLVRRFSLEHAFFVECIKVLQQTLSLSARSGSTLSVLVVSSLPAEGKTSIAVSVAMAFANQGKRTLIIDADLCTPMVERSLPLKASGRLKYCDADSMSWQVTLSDVVACPHLFVLSMCEQQSAFGNLGKAVRRIISEAASDFDVVVIDASPLNSAESIDLAVAATSTVIVARHAQTPLASIVESVETLRHVNVIPAGIVLNDCMGVKDPASAAYSKYYVST